MNVCNWLTKSTAMLNEGDWLSICAYRYLYRFVSRRGFTATSYRGLCESNHDTSGAMQRPISASAKDRASVNNCVSHMGEGVKPASVNIDMIMLRISLSSGKMNRSSASWDRATAS